MSYPMKPQQPKAKWITVGSVMKPFSKTKDGQPIAKEEQGNGYVSISKYHAESLAKELLKLASGQLKDREGKPLEKLSLSLNTREEQIQRLDSVVASGKMKPETAEKIKAGLLRGQEYVRFDLILNVQE